MNLSREEQLQQLLCAYILGEATSEERREIEAELEKSESLRQEKAQLESTISLVSDVCQGSEALSQESVQELTAAAQNSGGRVIQGPWHQDKGLRVAAGFLLLFGIAGAAHLMNGPEDRGSMDENLASLDDVPGEEDAIRGGESLKPEAESYHESGPVTRFSTSPAKASEIANNEVADPSVDSMNEFLENVGVDFRGLGTPEATDAEFFADFPAEEPAADAAIALQQFDNSVLGVSPTPMDTPAHLHGNVGSTLPVDGRGVALQSEAMVTQSQPGAMDSGAVRQLQAPGSAEPPPMEQVPIGGVLVDSATLAGLGYVSGGGGGGGAVAGKTSPGGTYVGPPAAEKPAGQPNFGREAKTAAVTPPAATGTPVNRPAPGRKGKRARTSARYAPVTNNPSSPGARTAVRERIRGEADLGGVDEFFLGDAEDSSDLGLFFDELSIDHDGDPAVDFYFRAGLRFELDEASRREFLGGEDRRVRRILTPDEIDARVRAGCKVIFDGCVRRPDETPRDMFYRYYGDNPFEMTSLDALSTFAADVDTSSYVLVRNYLKNRHLPEKAQVRTEEFVNYFRPDVPAPTEGVFRIATELAPSRFSDQPGRWMLRVAIRGREVAREERQPLCLTFVTDTSGSMKENGRMELVKHSLRLLLAQLDARDSISIIGFSNEARLILPMTSAANRGVIESAIYGMNPDGGTNAEAGLMMGYEVAGAALSQATHNRVVLLSDGVANIGQIDQDRINDQVKHQRDRGIYLNTIGVGMNNHNDVFLEQLANKGDGLANYIDDDLEARRALVENFTGTFEPIARDVKIQVEFDPTQVYRYRQLGYENRAVADANFRNDKVDAGEIGAGHQVVCLYELETTPSFNAEAQNALATVRVRYKQPTGAGRQPNEDSATEIEHKVASGTVTSFEGTSAGYRRSVLAAQFAEVLRRSTHARGDSLDDLIAASAKLAPEIQDKDFQELCDLVKVLRDEIMRRFSRRTELGDCIEDLRRHHLQQAEQSLYDAIDKRPSLEDFEKLRIDLERKIEELIRRRVEEEQAALQKEQR